jgi:hypothetical protein
MSGEGDMRFNGKFAELVDVGALNYLYADDLTLEDRRTVDGGWTRDERGAWLLRELLTTYHGSREAFTDLTGYEAAVNGRVIPDLDLKVDGKARAEVLARRGVAFARAALGRLNAEYPDHPPAIAYVSISDQELDDGIPYEGAVTFVTAHDGEAPDVRDLEKLTANAVMALDSADC